MANQIIAVIHRHKTSRLTIGEAKSICKLPRPYPYGEALLQIGHLRYHALDLNLSTEITEKSIGKNVKLNGPVGLHETCVSFPLSLSDKTFSDHGFILYLKGKNITAEKIVKIIGLKKNGLGGFIVASGQFETSILSIKRKGFFKKPSPYQKTFSKNASELVGVFNHDPHLNILSKGICELEKFGNLIKVDGEIVLAFYPLHQSFICEY